MADDNKKKEELAEMRKRIAMLITALMLALTMALGGAAAAFAENPHTGNSGNLGHNSQPCQASGGSASSCPGGGASFD